MDEEKLKKLKRKITTGRIKVPEGWIDMVMRDFGISREEAIERYLKEYGSELSQEKKPVKKINQWIFSPRSYNYLVLKTKHGEGTIRIPRFTSRQELLIDFIFSRLKKKVEKTPAENRLPINLEDFNFALSILDELPTGFTGLSFTTTEVRDELNIRYKEEDMIQDFRALRDGSFEIKAERIWVDESGKYKSTGRWWGSIIADMGALKTERVAPRTGEPIHKIILALGQCIGLLWRNDIIRKSYCLFPAGSDKGKNFGRLPDGAQKIYRYISLWNDCYLNIREFSDILGYKPTKNLTRRKRLIEGYLDILKEREFIYDWEPVEGTRGWKTQWYIQKTKKAKAESVRI